MQSQRKKVAVFGHYGNRNLGDEAIIEATLSHLRRVMPDVEIECFSINPFDSSDRHGVKAFPIRYRADYFELSQKAPGKSPTRESVDSPNHIGRPTGLKAMLKRVAPIRKVILSLKKALAFRKALKNEIRFVSVARRYLEDFDLLLVTGSNQFLDNFGGPWGFPYTLMKWSWIARRTNTKVAYVSVGAGPIYKRLSYIMLKFALRRAIYISFRDEGSRELIKNRIHIDGDVYPDIAHSLTLDAPALKGKTDSNSRKVAINPMPVYDKRYWYHVDEDKYRRYVTRLSDFCVRLMENGEYIVLFNTQTKDVNVMEDVLHCLRSDPRFDTYRSRVTIENCTEVSGLMSLLESSDVVVATRFHATVLPIQLHTPVLGICYYRKAVEQLIDVGLSNAYVEIDEFDPEELFNKYLELVKDYSYHEKILSTHADRYRSLLSEQFDKIVLLLGNDDQQELFDKTMPKLYSNESNERV